MNPALYYRIYEEGIDEQVILKYIKYDKSYYLYYLTINHVWGD